VIEDRIVNGGAWPQTATMLSRLVPASVVALTMVLASRPALADEPVVGPAYRLRLELDLSLVLVSAAVSSGFLFLDEGGGRGPSCAPVCDRSRVNFLDRPAAGLFDSGWSNVGDVAVAAAIVFPPLVIVLHEGLEKGLVDDVVVAEAALVTTAVQIVTSYAVQRPRPRAYGDDAPLEDRTDANAARSFFSGHVADTMAVTVAATRTFQRLQQPVLAGLVLGGGLAGTSFVAVSRVLAGGHFPTDVVAGAAVGAGLGLALPALHDSNVRVVPLAAGGANGLAVVGQWQ
jgi:membrane-associated phospholipid phosphatase